MNKLNYGNYDPTNSDIAFSSTHGYTDPANELEARKQLSYPLKELKTFVNNTVSTNEYDSPVQLVVESGKLKYRTEPSGTLTRVSGVPTGGTSGNILKKNSSDDLDCSWVSLSSYNANLGYVSNGAVPILTTAPTANYTGGGKKIVYLETEPTTKYSGYIYLIKE